MSKQPSSENSLPNEQPVSKYQGFEPCKVHRSALKNAPYNPRSMDDEARKKLRKQLKTHKLVEGIVWNVRTGNIVGGHQRIGIVDELERGQDYYLTVCKIDVDE